MMAYPVLAFYFTCLFLEAQTAAPNFSSFAHQASGFVSASVGGRVTLRCSHEGDVAARLYWYKQTLGQKPRLISTFYIYDKSGSFYGEFNSTRFILDNENGKNHLTISDLSISDSATYYCMSSFLYTLEISETIIMSVKGSDLNIPALVHQSESESIQPGGSVTLNCTVHSGTCDGEHSVYWFKQSEESHPGLIYTHGDSNDQCERKPNTQTHTCVYNLPMKDLNVSHAGTYYCAVASCGYILFGNGTKLDFEHGADLVYFCSGASAFTSILVVLLAMSVCIMSRNSCRSSESRAGFSAPSTTNEQDYRKADNLYYAALSVDLKNRLRQRDQTWSECVYYSLKK